MAKVNLMKEVLTTELREQLSEKKTKFGADLELCIQSGLLVEESHVGIYASDPDAYNTFGPLFDPIIAQVHGFHDRAQLSHPDLDFGDPNHADLDLMRSDPDGLIISTRVRVGRNLAGFPFSTFIGTEARADVEQRVEAAVQSFPTHLVGQYRHLTDIERTERGQLVSNHILFKEGDKFLESAGMYRDWPQGRGIFSSDSGSLHIWVNEEDHIRVISMSHGADLGQVYRNLIETVSVLSNHLNFAHDRKLGYLATCPTNLGTTLRASVLVRLPMVAGLPKFRQICAALELDIRGTHGEHTQAERGMYDISNKRRLGITEWQAVNQMAHGVKILLLIESSL